MAKSAEDDKAPRRAVVDATDVVGPRGGTIMVMTLECGHIVWARRKTPKRWSECVPCWFEARG